MTPKPLQDIHIKVKDLNVLFGHKLIWMSYVHFHDKKTAYKYYIAASSLSSLFTEE
jgi:hypothetical protein